MRKQPESTSSSLLRSQPGEGTSNSQVMVPLELLPDPTMLTAVDGIIQFANDRVARLFGYETGEMVSQHINRFIVSLHNPVWEDWATFNRLPDTKWQLLGTAKTGETFPVEIAVSVVALQDKDYIWLSIRKKPHDELEINSAYTRNLIEASPDPMLVINPAGKITDVNAASEKATGVTRDQLIGTDFADYFVEPEKAREVYQQVFASGYVADYPLTMRHQGKKVLYNASVYTDEKHQVLGVFATARDITAQRKQELEIKALNEELEQRIIELESFSYSVSHDLRAPLRAIDGFITIFLNNYLAVVDGEGQRLLGNVRQNVEKMSILIDELLTLSRIGMSDIHLAPIHMHRLVAAAIDELGDAKKPGTTITISELQDAVGDVTLLKQVWVNLLSNAFKYSFKKSNPEIEIGSYLVSDECHYYVKDNGVGFDMEYANKLFGVFQRLHDSSDYQGTGVGLAIVKRIITRHGGRVWAEGKEDDGATFFFSLKAK